VADWSFYLPYQKVLKIKTNLLLEGKKVKNRLVHKAYRNRPLSHWQIVFNKLASKTRWVVERTFGSIKKWFGGGKARYRGLQKTIPGIFYKPLPIT
jgi:IS5 family transposase